MPPERRWVVLRTMGESLNTALIVEVPLTAAFETVTALVLVALLPAASRATTLILCEPFETEVVSHENEYGDGPVVSVPMVILPSLISTAATPMLSVAVAVIDTVPETVAPFVGAVRETVGGVVSPLAVQAAYWNEALPESAPLVQMREREILEHCAGATTLREE